MCQIVADLESFVSGMLAIHGNLFLGWRNLEHLAYMVKYRLWLCSWMLGMWLASLKQRYPGHRLSSLKGRPGDDSTWRSSIYTG